MAGNADDLWRFAWQPRSIQAYWMIHVQCYSQADMLWDGNGYVIPIWLVNKIKYTGHVVYALLIAIILTPLCERLWQRPYAGHSESEVVDLSQDHDFRLRINCKVTNEVSFAKSLCVRSAQMTGKSPRPSGTVVMT